MTANDVLNVVRRRLGDVRKEGWTDEQLLVYISLCQNDICIFTHYHRENYLMPIYDGKLVYKLPSNCLAVKRIEYNCKFFPIESRNTIDDGKATFPCALKDQLAFGEIEIRLDEECNNNLALALESTYGVVASEDDNFCGLDDAYGVTASVIDNLNPPPEDSNLVGYLRIYYAAVPPILVNAEESLVLPDIWLGAFMHYVCGYALQDDNDANNIQRGEMELQKYQRVLTQIFKMSAKDFTGNYKSKLTTDVRRI